MPLLAYDRRLPQRIQLFDVSAVLHFHARHAVRIFAAGQASDAPIAVAAQSLGGPTGPRHGRYQHGSGGIDSLRQIKVEGRILYIFNHYLFDTHDLRPVGHVVVIALVAVIAVICALFSQTHTRADQEVGPLFRCHQHAPHLSLCDREGVLVVVTRATLQLAAVAQRPVPQLPLRQNPLLVTVCPQPFVCRRSAGQRQRCRCTCPRHGRQACATGQAAGGIFPAVECRPPGELPPIVVRRHIPGHGDISIPDPRAPGMIQIAFILPLFYAGGHRKAVDRRRLASQVKPVFAFQRQYVHGAVGQAQCVPADVPGHGVIFGPILHRLAGIGHQWRRLPPVRQVIHGGTVIVSTGLVIVKAQRISLVLPASSQQLCPSLKAGVLGSRSVIRRGPPQPKQPRGVLAVQHGTKHGVQLLGRNAGGSGVAFGSLWASVAFVTLRPLGPGVAGVTLRPLGPGVAGVTLRARVSLLCNLHPAVRVGPRLYPAHRFLADPASPVHAYNVEFVVLVCFAVFTLGHRCNFSNFCFTHLHSPPNNLPRQLQMQHRCNRPASS